MSTRKKSVKLLVLLFIMLLISIICIEVLPLFLNTTMPVEQTSEDLYVGVDVAYENVTATKQLIDKISSYTNVFVIGCLGNYNQTRLDQISQYTYDKGLFFIIYSDSYRYPSKDWLGNASDNWGNKFLGIYYFDEEGGKVLDQGNGPIVTSANNYTNAAYKYNETLNKLLRGNLSITKSFAYPTQYPLFTSDYALYWFDYQAGYDTVFAEFGWNNSRQLNIALCRGAATSFGKDWGVMITWTYNQPPYIEPGQYLYNDMVLAYENGAKYILIFDSNKEYSASILQQEHFEAMQQFWQYVKDHPRVKISVSERTAFVLPQDYAYGFRGEYDKIWGLWGPDSLTPNICMNVSGLLTTFGMNLDIVYPNGPQTIESLKYKNIFYWDKR